MDRPDGGSQNLSCQGLGVRGDFSGITFLMMISNARRPHTALSEPHAGRAKGKKMGEGEVVGCSVGHPASASASSSTLSAASRSSSSNSSSSNFVIVESVIINKSGECGPCAARGDRVTVASSADTSLQTMQHQYDRQTRRHRPDEWEKNEVADNHCRRCPANRTRAPGQRPTHGNIGRRRHPRGVRCSALHYPHGVGVSRMVRNRMPAAYEILTPQAPLVSLRAGTPVSPSMPSGYTLGREMC